VSVGSEFSGIQTHNTTSEPHTNLRIASASEKVFAFSVILWGVLLFLKSVFSDGQDVKYDSDITPHPHLFRRHTWENSKQNLAVMASDGPSPHSPSLRLGLTATQPSSRHHAQSLLGPSFHDKRTPHVHPFCVPIYMNSSVFISFSCQTHI